VKGVKTYLLDFLLRTNLRGTIGTSSPSIVKSTATSVVGVASTDGADFFIGLSRVLKISLFPSKARMLRPVPLQVVMQALAKLKQ